MLEFNSSSHLSIAIEMNDATMQNFNFPCSTNSPYFSLPLPSSFFRYSVTSSFLREKTLPSFFVPLFYLWTISNPKKSNKSHAPRSEVGKRKNQKSRKGPDKKKKVPDIAKIFFGKEAAAAAAATKTTGEKSTKISVPVKKKSVKSKMGQSSANESSPQPSSSGLQPITSTPNPPKEDAAPYRTRRKSSPASRPKVSCTIDVSCFGAPWILGLRIITQFWR